MNVGQICRRRIVTVDAAATPAQAAELMREHHVGALIVTMQTDEETGVVGVITDRDLVINVLARGLDAGAVEVGDLGGEQVVSVAEDDDVSRAINTMRTSGVRRLLVTNSEERLIGVVSLDDLVDACASDVDGLAQVIRAGIEREVAAASTAPPPEPLPLRIPAMGTAGWGKALA